MSQMLEALYEDDKIFEEIDLPQMAEGSPELQEQSRVAKTLYKVSLLSHFVQRN